MESYMPNALPYARAMMYDRGFGQRVGHLGGSDEDLSRVISIREAPLARLLTR